MSEAQRIIKYLAIAFAIFLIFNIFSLIFYGLSSLSNIFDEDEKLVNKLKVIEVNDASLLSVDISTTNLTIKSGNVLNVETDLLSFYIDVTYINFLCLY